MSTVIAPTFQLGNGFLRQLANNNQLAALVTLSSGDQQNIVANLNLNQDTIASVSRPLYVARNTARGPNVYQFDLRYTRTLFTLWDRVKPNSSRKQQRFQSSEHYRLECDCDRKYRRCGDEARDACAPFDDSRRPHYSIRRARRLVIRQRLNAI